MEGSFAHFKHQLFIINYSLLIVKPIFVALKNYNGT